MMKLTLSACVSSFPEGNNWGETSPLTITWAILGHGISEGTNEDRERQLCTHGLLFCFLIGWHISKLCLSHTENFSQCCNSPIRIHCISLTQNPPPGEWGSVARRKSSPPPRLPFFTETNITQSSLGAETVYFILHFCVTIHHLRYWEQKLWRNGFLAHSLPCFTSCSDSFIIQSRTFYPGNCVPHSGLGPPVSLINQDNFLHTCPYTNLI